MKISEKILNILKVRVLELGRGLLTKIFNTARDIAGDVN